MLEHVSRGHTKTSLNCYRHNLIIQRLFSMSFDDISLLSSRMSLKVASWPQTSMDLVIRELSGLQSCVKMARRLLYSCSSWRQNSMTVNRPLSKHCYMKFVWQQQMSDRRGFCVELACTRPLPAFCSVWPVAGGTIWHKQRCAAFGTWPVPWTCEQKLRRLV